MAVQPQIWNYNANQLMARLRLALAKRLQLQRQNVRFIAKEEKLMRKQMLTPALSLLFIAFGTVTADAQGRAQYAGEGDYSATSLWVTATVGKDHIRFASLGIGQRIRLESNAFRARPDCSGRPFYLIPQEYQSRKQEPHENAVIQSTVRFFVVSR